MQTPSLQLPLADPAAFLERHEAVLGHNARNVINIAPEVSGTLHLILHFSASVLCEHSARALEYTCTPQTECPFVGRICQRSLPHAKKNICEARSHCSDRASEEAAIRNIAGMQGWREEDVVSKGVWHLLADGTCMWSLSIVTRGAFSHVVVFR